MEESHPEISEQVQTNKHPRVCECHPKDDKFGDDRVPLPGGRTRGRRRRLRGIFSFYQYFEHVGFPVPP